jgi:hypothetical protein
MIALIIFTTVLALLPVRERGAASASPVPHCSKSSDVAAKLKVKSGASSTFYFLIEFTNDGSTTCSLSRDVRAQAVEGRRHEDVGPTAEQNDSGTVPRITNLHASGGKAYVEYYIVNAVLISKTKCQASMSDGVVLATSSAGRFYVAISRRGATTVCTKIPSTMIGFLSPRPY